jgi:cell division protein FtsA
MKSKTSVGIDIGTHTIKVVVSERTDGSFPKIIGTGYAQSKGLRYGYIVNTSDVQRSLKKALRMAEKTSGVTIEKAYLSMGGIGLDAVTSTGSTIIARGDNEVTELDIERALAASEQALPPPEITNKKILHSIPHRFILDGREVLGRPEGMKGVKFEATTLFITCLEQHLHDLVQAVEDLGVDVVDVVAAPVAASLVILSKAQKIAGCVLANIGSETITVVVYENSLPISLAVFPIGSNDITNDLALGLKVPLEEAEQIKLGGIIGASYSRKEYEDIIANRLSDMFELIEDHLQKIGKNGMLPAGIIITGGGSGVASIEDLAKAKLALPSQIGRISTGGRSSTKNHIHVKDASWSVAYGLAVLGFTNEDTASGGGSNVLGILKKLQKSAFSWLGQFLP